MRGAAARRRRPGRGLLAAVLAALVVGLLVRSLVIESFLVPTGSMAPTLLPGDHVLVWRSAYLLRLPLVPWLSRQLDFPRRGDVIVFRDPRGSGDLMVKRVVGLPGDVVEVREQVLRVNGVPQPRTDLGELAYTEPAEGDQPARTDTCRRWRERLASGPLAPAGDDPAADFERAAAAGEVSHDVLQCRRVRSGRHDGPYPPVAPGNLFVLGDNRDRSDDGRTGEGWEVPAGAVLGRAVALGWSRQPGEALAWPWTGVRIERLFKPVH